MLLFLSYYSWEFENILSWDHLFKIWARKYFGTTRQLFIIVFFHGKVNCFQNATWLISMLFFLQIHCKLLCRCWGEQILVFFLLLLSFLYCWSLFSQFSNNDSICSGMSLKLEKQHNYKKTIYCESIISINSVCKLSCVEFNEWVKSFILILKFLCSVSHGLRSETASEQQLPQEWMTKAVDLTQSLPWSWHRPR